MLSKADNGAVLRKRRKRLHGRDNRMRGLKHMKLISNSRIGYLAALAAGVALGIAAVGSATAAPAARNAPRTVTRHYALAASAFAPDSIQEPTQDYVNQWNPTSLSQSVGDRCFDAGLSLPPGATLKSVTFYYTHGSSVISMQVNRQNLLNHQGSVLVNISTHPTSPQVYTSVTRSFPASKAKVDSSKYAYSAGVCPNGTSAFSGLIITYTDPA